MSYQGFYTLYTKNTEIKKFPYIIFQNEFLLSPIYIFILMYKAYKVYKTIAKPLVLLTLFFIHFQKQVYKIFKKRIKNGGKNENQDILSAAEAKPAGI